MGTKGKVSFYFIRRDPENHTFGVRRFNLIILVYAEYAAKLLQLPYSMTTSFWFHFKATVATPIQGLT